MADDKSKAAPAAVTKAAEGAGPPPTTDGNTRPATAAKPEVKTPPVSNDPAPGKHADDKLKEARASLAREDKLEPEKRVSADDPDIIIEPTGEVSRNRPAEAANKAGGPQPTLEPERVISADDPDIIIEPTGEVSRNRPAERAAALVDEAKK